MQNLDEARRLNGAMHEQIRINEEIAEQSKSDAKPGEAKWAILFIAFVCPTSAPLRQNWFN